MTIGELAARAGLPVKTIRFYSDEGLLPPSGRTEAGYRIYSERDLLRLDVIVTLRDSGLDLGTIGAILREEMDLGAALELRLTAVEAHIVSLQQVAAAIRAALRSEPTQDDLRRLHAVTRLSNAERRAVIERFYEQLSDGISMDEDWKRGMIEASAPRLPDDPTKEQLDAWIELAEIVSDPGFIESMRKMSEQAWTEDFDHQAFQRGTGEVTARARAAIDAGVAPDSDEARSIVEQLVMVTASSSKVEPDAAFRASLRDRYENHDPRAARYWVLVGIMNGQAMPSGPVEEWDWIAKAVVHHL